MPAAITLGQRYRAILSYSGLVLLLVGLLMLTPLAGLAAYPQEAVHAAAFLVPGLSTILVGMVLWRWLRYSDRVTLTIQEGGVIVLLTWVTVCVVSALPLMATVRLNFTQAVFESVSGWTTTGLSVVDVTAAPKVVLLWRSIMQLAGGAGLAIIMLATLTGPTGVGLSSAEGRSDQLVPHVRQSAKLVLLIYAGYAVVGTVEYRLAGMDWFDALNHSFPAVSTGGFSTQPESIGHWDSVAIEAVSLPLMIMGNLSFVTAWLMLQGKWRAVVRNGEVRLMAILLPVSVLALALLTTRGLYPTLGKQVRVAAFEAVSALTTTGFSTVSYADWNGFGWLVMIALMLVGGGTCSTAGGLKQFRVYYLAMSVGWEIRRAFLPRTAVVEIPVWQGETRRYVSDGWLRQIAAFAALYLITYVIGTAILAAYGYKLADALFEFASALGTVGLSVGVTAPNAPAGVLWTETAGMFLGRLEFFVILTSLGHLGLDAIRVARGAVGGGRGK